VVTNQKLAHCDLVYWVYRSCAGSWASLSMGCCNSCMGYSWIGGHSC